MSEYDLKYNGTKKEAQKLGAFFTPMSLGNRMADRFSGSPNGKTVLDPSCGYGNLLLVMLDRKVAGGEDPEQALSEIYGIELDPRNREICLRNLRKWADAHGARWDEDAMRSRIVEGDALADQSYGFPDAKWGLSAHADLSQTADGVLVEIVRNSKVVRTAVYAKGRRDELKDLVRRLREKGVTVRKFARS